MARKALGPASLAVVQAVAGFLADDGLTRVGVSGGADSMALAAGVVHCWRRDGSRGEGARVEAMVVDHGLFAGSARVAADVVARLEALGMPARSVRVRVESAGLGVEAAAREARYAALLADCPARVLLGHTLDDQAETVLLGLARGSGTRSLAGMPVRRGVIARPLLGLRRETTRDACREWGIETWRDPANDDPSYLRVRVRHTVLPTLERELGPGIAEALARTARLASDDADALDDEASRVDAVVAGQLEIARVAGLADAVRSRVVRAWLLGAGIDFLDADRTAAVLTLIDDWRGQKGIAVPGGVVRRAAGRLVFEGLPLSRDSL